MTEFTQRIYSGVSQSLSYLTGTATIDKEEETPPRTMSILLEGGSVWLVSDWDALHVFQVS